jgi:hypothetical protein
MSQYHRKIGAHTHTHATPAFIRAAEDNVRNQHHRGAECLRRGSQPGSWAVSSASSLSPSTASSRSPFTTHGFCQAPSPARWGGWFGWLARRGVFRRCIIGGHHTPKGRGVLSAFSPVASLSRRRGSAKTGAQNLGVGKLCCYKTRVSANGVSTHLVPAGCQPFQFASLGFRGFAPDRLGRVPSAHLPGSCVCRRPPGRIGWGTVGGGVGGARGYSAYGIVPAQSRAGVVSHEGNGSGVLHSSWRQKGATPGKDCYFLREKIEIFTPRCAF